MVEVVPLHLFGNQCTQVLEVVRVLGEVADMAGLEAQSARLRHVEASVVEAAGSMGVRAVPAVDSRAVPAVDSAHVTALAGNLSVAGGGAAAVAALRSASPSPRRARPASACQDAPGSGRLTISARDLLAQLENARLGMRQLRSERQAANQETERQSQLLHQETEQLKKGEQILEQNVCSVREEVQAAVAETRAMVEALEARLQGAAMEAKRARDHAAMAYEATTRAGKDAEAYRARAATDVTEVQASIGELSTEVRMMQQSLQQCVSGMQESEQGRQLSISQQALGAVAALEERLSRRLAESRRELEARQSHFAEQHKSIANRIGEDRASISALEAELRHLRAWADAGGLSSAASCGQPAEMPSAWRVALDDAVHRAQFAVDEAHRQAEECRRQAEVRLQAFIAEQARDTAAREASARAASAENTAEKALRQARAAEGAVKRLQQLAVELRAEWRADLRAAAGSWLGRAEQQDGTCNRDNYPVIIISDRADLGMKHKEAFGQ